MARKTYAKPAIFFQTLDMVSGSSCETQATFAEFSCPVTLEDFPFTLFTESTCEASGEDMDDMICYHVPVESFNVFSS